MKALPVIYLQDASTHPIRLATYDYGYNSFGAVDPMPFSDGMTLKGRYHSHAGVIFGVLKNGRQFITTDCPSIREILHGEGLSEIDYNKESLPLTPSPLQNGSSSKVIGFFNDMTGEPMLGLAGDDNERASTLYARMWNNLQLIQLIEEKAATSAYGNPITRNTIFEQESYYSYDARARIEFLQSMECYKMLIDICYDYHIPYDMCDIEKMPKTTTIKGKQVSIISAGEEELGDQQEIEI